MKRFVNFNTFAGIAAMFWVFGLWVFVTVGLMSLIPESIELAERVVEKNPNSSASWLPLAYTVWSFVTIWIVGGIVHYRVYRHFWPGSNRAETIEV